MKNRTILRISMAPVMMTIMVAAFAATLYAEDDGPHCTNASLKGDYGVQISGTQPTASGATETVIGVLVRVFDGNGNFSQTDYVKGSASGIISNGPGAGTYSVNEDCSGVMNLIIPGLPFALVERMVLVDRGREYRTINATPEGVFISGIGKRIR
jgi:hypothetical protein